MNRAEKDERIRMKKDFMYKFKSELVCSHCGISTTKLHFHHIIPRVPGDGQRLISSIGIITPKSIAKLEKELKKCIPLCSSCHKKHHNTNKGE
jgi:5-methylcytosine-specific restriction endonuclease McrA